MLEEAHPELEREQAYVDRAYACMDVMRREVSEMRFAGRNDFEEEAFERWQETRVRALSDTTSALVFGRTDTDADETFYIGRHHVREANYETVVVDWRAPVATAYYRAGVHDPMGLRRRRQFLVEGREILGISDDHLGEDGTVRGEEILHHELARQRSGRMRDVVATIQAEQDIIIRAPLEGTVVVQGGPGTGKTAIGLHRAAFLLYEHRRTLVRKRVLVVGPNRVFITYVSEVLPSLGESAMIQVAVDDLAPGPRGRGRDTPDAERLKGDVRMAEVIRRALAERCSPLTDDVPLEAAGVRFALHADAVNEHARTLRERGAPHGSGRELLRDKLLVDAYRAYQDNVTEVSQPFDEIVSVVRKDNAFRAALDAVWPSVGAERLVADLYASPSRLAAASDGILDTRERRALKRPRKAEWTYADRPLLDEAQALIAGAPDRYGHVVVDEAQDLSPMQLRMLARRCPEGSMTVLGDIGQATGAWAHDDWSEVLEHLPAPDGSRVDELTLGYRVGAAIMDVAARILAEAAPRLRAPGSVRREHGEVTIRAAVERGASVVEAVGGKEGAVAVIVPDALLDEIRSGLRAGGVGFGEGEHGDLSQPVTLVPVSRCKGLEFDSVVVVEPSAIVEQAGLRMLYVAVTRAMRTLDIVHVEPLPAPLQEPAAARAS